MALELHDKEVLKGKKLILPYKGRKHPVRAMLEAMQVGQVLRVGPEDFTWRHQTITKLVREVMEKLSIELVMHREADTKVWWVERVK